MKPRQEARLCDASYVAMLVTRPAPHRPNRDTDALHRAALASIGHHDGITSAIVGLAPFIFVTEVERSIAFYEVLGFAVVDRYEPDGTLEFAGLQATPAAKLMLARVGEAPRPVDPDAPGPGFLYLYTPDLDALREQLVGAGYEPGEIRDGRPGPDREMCVIDPDGHGHMVAELS